ncbi:MAG: BrxA/BrxB family bacilliredoxin [Chitinophagales bacterium]|nr:BrxA/BrxB family bacilliredoxin [Chitinophagales bacterium]
MYPPELVAPMKKELVDIGFSELLNPSDVDNVMSQKEGTTLVVVNSICGCAARMARPAVKLALQNSSKKPQRLTTVFAGVDFDAVNKVRTYMAPYPPSSPSMALYKDGKLVHFLERHHIEGVPAEVIAANLQAAFEEYC